MSIRGEKFMTFQLIGLDLPTLRRDPNPSFVSVALPSQKSFISLVHVVVFCTSPFHKGDSLVWYAGLTCREFCWRINPPVLGQTRQCTFQYQPFKTQTELLHLQTKSIYNQVQLEIDFFHIHLLTRLTKQFATPRRLDSSAGV
jgi:hypothetical protein